MDWKKSKRLLAILALIYWVLALTIYAVAYGQFRYQSMRSEALSPSFYIGEITDGTEVRQRVTVPANRLDAVRVMAGLNSRVNQGELCLSLVDASGAEVARGSVDVSALQERQYVAVPLEQPLSGRKGEAMTLLVTAQNSAPGSAVTLYAGNMISAGRFDVARTLEAEDLYTLNGAPGAGMLCVELSGVDEISFYRVYWLIVGAVFLLAAGYTLIAWRGARRGQANVLAIILNVYCRYGFMVRQLVSRDFKTKYKRSILGLFWSFLNPLLTTLVQYVVFSTLFRGDIPNFPVYLITGVVFFNFFNEAVSQGMSAITGNAALIKKVYMPKYIYPLAKILSSLVNFALALLPLLLVILFTGTPIRPAVLLLIFDILCLVGFVSGVTLLLATAMTFFQDMQFLWGIISMMWMYMTPLFYPETIIPANLLGVYRLNPLYQYITFARTCILDGISPAPQAYGMCLASAAVALMLGLWVFKRHQDQFVLHL